ncbi:MAG: hypothetical protein H7Y31_08660 [Chitinophagaceae bacterium]|nr:hypothetical protein [Chitinophagaceae bacterium]
MKLFIFAAAAAVCLLSSSCHKDGNFNVECRILTITENYQPDPSATPETTILSLSYNEKGNPIRFDYDNNVTGRPDYTLEYDHHDRLQQVVQAHGATLEYITNYYYNGGHQITRDTAFYIPVFSPPIEPLTMSVIPVESFSTYITNQYKYDGEGRIVRVDSKTSDGAEHVTTYSYDGHGNLNNGTTYDDKENFLRTNNILAFLQRNYSKNNSGTPLAYGEKNLPTMFTNFTPGEAGFSTRATFLNMDVHAVTYICVEDEE